MHYPLPEPWVAGVILARGSGGSELRKEVLNTIATAIPAARVCRAEKALALGLLDRLPCAVPVGGSLAARLRPSVRILFERN